MGPVNSGFSGRLLLFHEGHLRGGCDSLLYEQLNNYMWPLIVLQSNDQKTMQLFVSSLASAYFPEYGVVMNAILISTLPMIVIFFGLQKYFVHGITGSVKQ